MTKITCSNDDDDDDDDDDNDDNNDGNHGDNEPHPALTKQNYFSPGSVNCASQESPPE